ncbi:leucine-rich repeat domain-containing protein [Fibrella arboris]|uniref:leucine-rich repeat domain-containing protein n=1 Tax=Fibrella arboris TaxID=3242486 RepID=UPI00352133A2
MKTLPFVLALSLLLTIAAQAQVTVLLRADTAKYGISPAKLEARYPPVNKLYDGMTAEQRTALFRTRSDFDRSRRESIEKQGPVPGYGFSYQLTEYVRANGTVEWVLLQPSGIVPDKLLQELVTRLAVFYQATPLPATISTPYQTTYRTSYGRPLYSEKRLVRTGDSTISTLEAARTTTRPDTVKYLHVNQLALSKIPDVVYRFPNLEELDLSKNQLTQLPARLITDIPSLKRLNVLFNQIGNDSVFIPKNTHLRALTLQGNKLTRIPASVRNCKALESLWMGNNTLTEVSLKPLRGLRKLNDLNFYNAGLTSLPRQIRKLKHVVVLDLYYNQLTELPRQMGRMKRLEQLAVANNNLASLPPQLARLRNLNTLFVHHNKLSQLPGSFVKLRSLGILDIGYNQFSNVPDVLAGLGTLESVDISHNNIQTLPTSLIGLRNLKKFYIRSNPLTQNDAKSGPYAQLIEALETNKTEVFY